MESERGPKRLTFSALDCLFDTLKTHGKSFTPSFWSTISTQILFPIFNILRSSSTDNTARFKSHEDMSVWLSTTLISALRNMIDLWTVYFEVMQEYLDGLLDILVACICQGKSVDSSRREERDHISFIRERWLISRKRYTCSNRYFMFPTTP
jgi:Sec7-like guanine-nucleotide exchange factor